MPERRRLILLTLVLVSAMAATGAVIFAQVIAPRETAPETAPAATTPSVDQKYLDSLGIRYWLVVKTDPRPLRIHHLRVALAKAKVDLIAACGEDPDAGGPATAKLTPPLTLAERSGAVALVNASRWQSLPDKDGKRTTDWKEDMPVEVLGLVISEGKVQGAPIDRYCAFWVDRAGAPHIGAPDFAQAREGVAGFPRLLDAGKNLHVAKPKDPVHPRTALGLDAAAKILTLIVVDGRQEGYSMGMTCFELAEYMKDLGCSDAVNLDGGGSSVMILSDAAGARRIVNDPSTKVDGKSVARPIPVGLAIRAR